MTMAFGGGVVNALDAFCKIGMENALEQVGEKADGIPASTVRLDDVEVVV